MSRILKRFLVPLCALIAVTSLVWLNQNTSSRHLSHDHEHVLAKVMSSSTISMEKHLSPIKVSLKAMEEIPEGPDQLLALKAEIISTYRDFGPLHYNWNLPSEVELVSGSLTGTVASPEAGKPYEIEIVVKNFDRQYRRKILIKAQVTDPTGTQLHNTALITSRPEDSMEHLAPMMMVEAQEIKAQNRVPASTSE